MSLGVAADERFGKDDEFGPLLGGIGCEVRKFLKRPGSVEQDRSRLNDGDTHLAGTNLRGRFVAVAIAHSPLLFVRPYEVLLPVRFNDVPKELLGEDWRMRNYFPPPRDLGMMPVSTATRITSGLADHVLMYVDSSGTRTLNSSKQVQWHRRQRIADADRFHISDSLISHLIPRQDSVDPVRIRSSS